MVWSKGVLVGVGFLSIVLLTDCTQNSPNDDVPNASDEEYAAYMEEVEGYNTADVTETNPCLDSELLAQMKSSIKDDAIESVQAFTGDSSYMHLIDQSEITFDNITQPIYSEDGSTQCSANVKVTYYGDDATKPDIVLIVAQMSKMDIPYTGNAIADASLGYTAIRSIKDNLGINQFTIDRFKNIEGDEFTTNVDYSIQTTYDESGTSQEYFEAEIVPVAKMLATVFVYDKGFKESLSQ